MWKDLCAFGVFNALYATYLEINPKIGGVIMRPDANGDKKVNLSSYWNFIKQPVICPYPEVKQELWKPKNWDLNYIMSALIFMFGYKAASLMIEEIKKGNTEDLENPIFQ
jgi:hypothetical protein